MDDFQHMMTHLPEPVPDTHIMHMFAFADKDKDGRISWEEFLVTKKLIFILFADFHCM